MTAGSCLLITFENNLTLDQDQAQQNIGLDLLVDHS